MVAYLARLYCHQVLTCMLGIDNLFLLFWQIWENILGFENAEFYVKRWPQLDGMCFEDVLISFPEAIPCGIKVASDGGKIILNPEDNYVLREGDEVLVIAEDDDTYAPGPLPEVILSLSLCAVKMQNFSLVDVLCFAN